MPDGVKDIKLEDRTKLAMMKRSTVSGQLTTRSRFTGYSAVFGRSFNPLKEFPTVPYILRRPELLIDLERTQSLASRIFQPALLIPNPSLQFHRVTKVARIVNGVGFSLFDVGICIAKLVFIEK